MSAQYGHYYTLRLDYRKAMLSSSYHFVLVINILYQKLKEYNNYIILRLFRFQKNKNSQAMILKIQHFQFD